MASFTPKSASARLTHGIAVQISGIPTPPRISLIVRPRPGTGAQEKAIEKKIAVSSPDEKIDDTKGGSHQAFSRRRSKIATSRSWATRKALPEAMAMRGVARAAERITAAKKPT